MENTARWAAGRLANAEEEDGYGGLDPAGAWVMADRFSDTESLDAELLGSGGSCPPDSFLEGFTRHFVENYRPAHALETDEIDGVVASLVSSQRQRQQQEEQFSYYSPSSASPSPSPSSSRHYSPAPSIHQAPPSPPAAPEEPQTPQDRQLRGTAAIDKHARRQLWGRVRRMGDAGGSSEAEEQRIEELVRMAEALEIHHDGGGDGPREPPRVLPTPAAATTQQALPTARQSADGGDKGEREDRRASDGECYWQPQEWIQWGAVVEDDGAGEAAGRLPLDSHEMARRLESVHEMHPDAWRHGFRDLALPNGKLQRTYSTQPVVLQAYPDGNVKRTLFFAPAGNGSGSGSEPGSGVRAVTLYYANGDWSCSAPGLWCCYYYCHERVWHKQTD
ncbi:hypothetical protein LPJ72_001080 [Coemansia sp. Benny D160-2]|nr:hypothetical protein LPJ72_001080 [Coemansia sp. Benny D160-2]